MPSPFGDVRAEMEGLQHGAGFLIFIECGVIHNLEGYTYDEDWPDEVRGFTLRNIDSEWPSISTEGAKIGQRAASYFLGLGKGGEAVRMILPFLEGSWIVDVRDGDEAGRMIRPSDAYLKRARKRSWLVGGGLGIGVGVAFVTGLVIGVLPRDFSLLEYLGLLVAFCACVASGAWFFWNHEKATCLIVTPTRFLYVHSAGTFTLGFSQEQGLIMHKDSHGKKWIIQAKGNSKRKVKVSVAAFPDLDLILEFVFRDLGVDGVLGIASKNDCNG